MPVSAGLWPNNGGYCHCTATKRARYFTCGSWGNSYAFRNSCNRFWSGLVAYDRCFCFGNSQPSRANGIGGEVLGESCLPSHLSRGYAYPKAILRNTIRLGQRAAARGVGTQRYAVPVLPETRQVKPIRRVAVQARQPHSLRSAVERVNALGPIDRAVRT